jgi:hypothetical protein
VSGRISGFGRRTMEIRQIAAFLQILGRHFNTRRFCCRKLYPPTDAVWTRDRAHDRHHHVQRGRDFVPPDVTWGHEEHWTSRREKEFGNVGSGELEEGEVGLCGSRRIRKVHFADAIRSQVVVCIVADGRKNISPRVLDCLASLGVYQEGQFRISDQ